MKGLGGRERLMKSETLQWSEGERELGSRIVFGWVKGGCKPQATSPKGRQAGPQLVFYLLSSPFDE